MFHHNTRTAVYYKCDIYKQEYFTSIRKISIVHENHTAVLIHKIMNYDYVYNSMPYLRLHTFIQRLSVHLCKEIIFVLDRTLLCLLF